MPTERVNYDIYAGPLSGALEARATEIFNGLTPATDIFQHGQPLEAEFVVTLSPAPDFPATVVTVALDGSDVGGPRPTFEPIEGASFTFGAAGGEQRVTIAGAALRRYVCARWAADREVSIQRRDMLRVTAVALVKTVAS